MSMKSLMEQVLTRKGRYMFELAQGSGVTEKRLWDIYHQRIRHSKEEALKIRLCLMTYLLQKGDKIRVNGKVVRVWDLGRNTQHVLIVCYRRYGQSFWAYVDQIEDWYPTIEKEE